MEKCSVCGYTKYQHFGIISHTFNNVNESQKDQFKEHCQICRLPKSKHFVYHPFVGK